MSKKKLRILKYVFLVIAYICLFAPTLILFIRNREVYFRRIDGWSIGFAGVIGVAYVMYLVKVGMKAFKPWAGTLIFMIICYCFQSVADYIFEHSVALFVGVLLYNLSMIPHKFYKELLHTYVDEEVRMVVRETPRKKKAIENVDTGRC